MLDGIDYYPRRKKSKKTLKIVLFLVLIILLSYWYFAHTPNQSNRPITSIVISVPEIVTIPVNISAPQQQSQPPKKMLIENLDEVMQIYNREGL